jgi:hypothetical protein
MQRHRLLFLKHIYPHSQEHLYQQQMPILQLQMEPLLMLLKYQQLLLKHLLVYLFILHEIYQIEMKMIIFYYQ